MKINVEVTRTWYQEAAKGGYGYAQWRLGMAYEYGKLDLTIDLQLALDWPPEGGDGWR